MHRRASTWRPTSGGDALEAESGFYVPGQTRYLAAVRTRTGPAIVVARNNDRPMLFRPAGAPARATTLARR